MLITASDGTATPVYADSFGQALNRTELGLQSGQSVPFGKMKAIDVVTLSENHARVRITLQDGRVVEGSIGADSSIFNFIGENDLGRFELPASKVKRIEFRR